MLVAKRRQRTCPQTPQCSGMLCMHLLSPRVCTKAWLNSCQESHVGFSNAKSPPHHHPHARAHTPIGRPLAQPNVMATTADLKGAKGAVWQSIDYPKTNAEKHAVRSATKVSLQVVQSCIYGHHGALCICSSMHACMHACMHSPSKVTPLTSDSCVHR
jgi:hypothetical protein